MFGLQQGAIVGGAGSGSADKQGPRPSAVYTFGVPPVNNPELAAQLRDGNRFNSCIEADDQTEAEIEFHDEYLLERVIITTAGMLLFLWVSNGRVQVSYAYVCDRNTMHRDHLYILYQLE